MFKTMSLVVFSLFPLSALATVNGRCVKGSDPLYNNFGICVSTKNCKKYGGHWKSDLCPYDGEDIKCCVVEESWYVRKETLYVSSERER